MVFVQRILSMIVLKFIGFFHVADECLSTKNWFSQISKRNIAANRLVSKGKYWRFQGSSWITWYLNNFLKKQSAMLKNLCFAIKQQTKQQNCHKQYGSTFEEEIGIRWYAGSLPLWLAVLLAGWLAFSKPFTHNKAV